MKVLEGSTTDNIVRYARENNITFTLMGKKSDMKAGVELFGR
jgi:K+-sensing histidine kinase KdpD